LRRRPVRDRWGRYEAWRTEENGELGLLTEIYKFFNELGWLVALAVALSFLRVVVSIQRRATNRVIQNCRQEDYEFTSPPGCDPAGLIINVLLFIIWPAIALCISPKLLIVALFLVPPLAFLAFCEFTAQYEEARSRQTPRQKSRPSLFTALLSLGRHKPNRRNGRVGR
jgi:hypothetical protein